MSLSINMMLFFVRRLVILRRIFYNFAEENTGQTIEYFHYVRKLIAAYCTCRAQAPISIFTAAFIAFQNEIEIEGIPPLRPIVPSHGNYFRCFRFSRRGCDLTETASPEHDFHPRLIMAPSST